MPNRTPESQFKYDILKFISTLQNVKMFNNVQGSGFVGRVLKHNGTQVILAFARRITFGLFGTGGCDLIGWKTITITESMVGQQVAVFYAAELKRPDGKGKATPEQLDIVDLINRSGGRSAIINSIQEFRNFIGEE